MRRTEKTTKKKYGEKKEKKRGEKKKEKKDDDFEGWKKDFESFCCSTEWLKKLLLQYKADF